jgi:predicted RNase H-like HicB family nuclease
MKKPGDVYQRVVVWSDEDNCFIGMCPELFNGGVHGDDALKVFEELDEVIDEWIEIYKEDGDQLPEPKGVPRAEMKEAA